MNLYKTKITMESVVEISVQAEEEGVARKKAEQLALEQFPGESRVSKIDISLTSESNFKVGTKVRHKIFGIGVIKDLAATKSVGGDSGWRVTIEFEENGKKDIAIMPGKQFLESIDA